LYSNHFLPHRLYLVNSKQGGFMAEKDDAVADILDNLRRVFQVVNEHSKRAEHKTGLTGPQLWAIKTIAQGAPIMVSEIAKNMHLHPATVVGILDRLEARGLVVRIRSKEDRRVVRVQLTALGQNLVRKAPEVAQGLLVSGLEELRNKDLKIIAGVLDQLAGILGAQHIPPKLLLSSEVNRPGRINKKTRRRRL
jgi:DNA-binding MarR family transcriptional regulator